MSRSVEAKLLCLFCDQNRLPTLLPKPYTGPERRRRPHVKLDDQRDRRPETGLTGPEPEK